MRAPNVGLAVGSSPLTRGKHFDDDHGRLVSGLIPAHAGKTDRRGRRRFRWWAHPRSRGENPAPSWPGVARRGSSPLTRGKQQRPDRGSIATRLIPAHAGKTDRRGRRRFRWWAHPRSRGENPAPSWPGVARRGSSPLTRGKQQRPDRGSIATRLIPAHAGKTG